MDIYVWAYARIQTAHTDLQIEPVLKWFEPDLECFIDIGYIHTGHMKSFGVIIMIVEVCLG